MLDNLKLITTNQIIIKRLAHHPAFKSYKHKNNNYAGFCVFGNLMRLDFRKSIENGVLVGYHHLEIVISPHYHFNKYNHNGNDFTPTNSIKSIIDILSYINIAKTEFNSLQVVNIEFGINIIPKASVKDIVTGLLFHKKAAFIINNFPYSKITQATNYKQIKAYAKGLQFINTPEYNITPNTFRFEVKSKQAKNIRKYGINTVNDLLRIEIYDKLAQELINEWENILLINIDPDVSNLKLNEEKDINKRKDIAFWNDLIQNFHRDKFTREKTKYYKALKGRNNLHLQVKMQIIDKLYSFLNVANSTQKTLIKSENLKTDIHYPIPINLEYATMLQNNKSINICSYTK